MSKNLRKLLRFAGIYGPQRAFFKAAGRMRCGRVWMLAPRLTVGPRDIGVTGCGQFAFATIGHVISTRLGARFAASYDRDRNAATTFARFYGSSDCPSADAVIHHPDVQVVYVASNHATHATYAAKALRAGKDVYVEMPIAVSAAQLQELLAAHAASPGRLFAGYNRPFSPAVRELKSLCTHVRGPLTLSCTIVGHSIAPDHWYRDPDEGTRICGNLGHWLDLAVHILCWRAMPDDVRISCTWSDDATRDDNLAVTLTTGAGDLINLVMTSRSETFEGVTETIILQCEDVIATIDDFRTMTVRRGSQLLRRTYRPKDVGHSAAILQPFGTPERDFREVVASSELMLTIADMVRNGVRDRRLTLSLCPSTEIAAIARQQT